MHMRGRTLSLLLITPALALSACGGGSSDEDQIKDIVKKVDANSSAICDYATKNLLNQLGGTKADCEKAARAYASDSNSEKVQGDITVKVDGDTATADFKTNKSSQHVTFVKENGDWKVDKTT